MAQMRTSFGAFGLQTEKLFPFNVLGIFKTEISDQIIIIVIILFFPFLVNLT